MISGIVELFELLISVFKNKTSSDSPRWRFNRRLKICFILIPASFLLAFVILPWANYSLWGRLTLYFIALVIIVGLIIFLTKRVSVRCENPDCNKIIFGDAPWLCLACLQENLHSKLFSFLYRCEHCEGVQAGYICDYCEQKIPLGNQREKIEDEYCARKIYTADELAVSIDEAEEILRKPRIHRPGEVVKDIDEAGAQLNRVKKFEDIRKGFEKSGGKDKPITESEKIRKNWRSRQDKRTTLHEFKEAEKARIRREVSDHDTQELLLNDLDKFIDEELKRKY